MDTPADQFLISFVRSALLEHADPARAAAAQAYMKSRIPSLGVRVPDVRRIAARAVREHPPLSAAQLRSTVLDLWRTSTYREEKYAAIDLTAHRLLAADPDMLAVYEEIIRTGAWWDLVDGVSGRICSLLQAHPTEMSRLLLQWSKDPDLWIRRAAITSQLRAGKATDTQLLAAIIEPNLADQEFFIRKAIGWALREYAKTAPEWVEAFVSRNRDAMSPLSRREALRRISARAAQR
jgi:3-methyladenine DNA glycosylase AlkD